MIVSFQGYGETSRVEPLFGKMHLSGQKTSGKCLNYLLFDKPSSVKEITA